MVRRRSNAKATCGMRRQPPNLIGMMKMELDMREKEAAAALLWAPAATAAVPPPPAIQSSQFGNRVNLIWLALGIQYICIPFIFLYGYYYTYMVEKHVKRDIFECIKDHSYY